MSTFTATAIRLEAIRKAYAESIHALNGIDLQVAAGEWMVLLGPSGCGKTTMLRIIAGLEKPSGGTVWLNGQNADQLAPWRRNIAMVFQRPALAPTQTVEQNLASGMKQPDPVTLTEVAELLDLTALMRRLPYQLSGGEQQRVSLGRALAKQAPLCLLDEPLSHIDAPQRAELRRALQTWHQAHPATVISVTHDPREAWALAQRVAVMDQGRVIQVGPPIEVYEHPFNRFVAAFFSNGPMNFLEVRLRREGNSLQWTASDWPQTIAFQGRSVDEARLLQRVVKDLREPVPLAAGMEREILEGFEAVLGLRAENVSIGAADGLPMHVELAESTPQGDWVTGNIDGKRVTGWSKQAIAVGEKVSVTMDWTKAFVFDRVTGETLHAPRG